MIFFSICGFAYNVIITSYSNLITACGKILKNVDSYMMLHNFRINIKGLSLCSIICFFQEFEI